MSFCTACGRAATGHAFCTSCGKPVDAAARTAPGAAAAVPAPVALPPGAQPAPWAGDPAPAGRRRSPLTLALVGLTVVLAGVAAVLLFLRFDDPPSVAAAPTPTATSQRSDEPRQATPTREPVETPEPSSEPVPTGQPSAPPAPPAATLPQTPFQVVILASKTEAEGGRAAVEPLAAEVEAAGYPALVFTSADHSSLNPGYWVAAAGPFPDAASAASAATAMRGMSSSFGTAYPRCVGEATQCP